MKKINPKVTVIAVMLLSLLVAGGLALDESIGAVKHIDNGGDNDDSGVF